MRGRARIALLSPYWAFWERSATVDLRRDRAELARAAASALDAFDVVADEGLDSPESALAAAEGIAAAGAEALLVLQSMAVPPAYTVAALDALPQLPVVVWAVHRRRTLPATLDHADITTEGATVGTSQLGNVLARRRRPFALVVGPLDDEETRRAVARAAAAAATASRLRGARIASVGPPPDGYDCVEHDAEALQRATGIATVQLEPDVLRDAYFAVDEQRVAAIGGELERAFEVDGELVGSVSLERSLRLAAALEDVDAAHALDAGAINCHIPQIRFCEEPGVTPCLALGRETSRGKPWACARDVITAVAMLTTKWLGAAALYHELESLDYETGEVAIASSGEHDLAWADPDRRPVVVRNGWFATDPLSGVCACMRPPAGPATLVAFTPHPDEPSGFRYVVAEGELTGREFPGAGTANGAFRFAGRDVVEGYERWVRAGANHHSSSTPGLLGEQVEQVASFLGVGCYRVS